MKDIAFYLGTAFLFTHELDAMPNHEWRVFPLLNSLSDDAAQSVFLLAHVPLFAIVIALVASLDPRIRTAARHTACGFFVAHAGLHYVFSGNTAYEFSAMISSILIYGAALSGLVYFSMLAFERKPGAP